MFCFGVGKTIIAFLAIATSTLVVVISNLIRKKEIEKSEFYNLYKDCLTRII